MKKILMIIVLIILIPFFSISALENDMTIKFSASFEENIDIDKIEKIFIMMDDATGQDYEIVLEKDKDFSLEMKNITNGDVVINSIFIYQDFLANYEFEENIIRESDNELDVKIIVRQAIKDANKEPAVVDDNTLKRILGTNTTNNIETTTTTKEIIIPSNDNSKTTTKIEQEEAKAAEEAKKQEETKKKNQDKREYIYKIIFSIILLIALVFILIGMLKIANANK